MSGYIIPISFLAGREAGGIGPDSLETGIVTLAAVNSRVARADVTVRKYVFGIRAKRLGSRTRILVCPIARSF